MSPHIYAQHNCTSVYFVSKSKTTHATFINISKEYLYVYYINIYILYYNDHRRVAAIFTWNFNTTKKATLQKLNLLLVYSTLSTPLKCHVAATWQHYSYFHFTNTTKFHVVGTKNLVVCQGIYISIVMQVHSMSITRRNYIIYQYKCKKFWMSIVKHTCTHTRMHTHIYINIACHNAILI